MCGIAGIIGIEEQNAKVLISAMTEAIGHRGPDSSAIYTDNLMAFGHTRLSIIDLDNGANQPFTDISGRYVIVFNGEIYNYKTVRDQLDYNWKTHSDTEVILAAFIHWGKDCLSHLNGMFAFAIWDKISEELFIARDRLGVKPFYYHHSENLFVFASEIRSILASDLLERKIDLKALNDYLANMTVKTPATMIKGVLQLKPGHYAFYKQGVLKQTQYWQMDKVLKSDSEMSYEETLDKVRSSFKDSVRSRMVADVKVGAFLSGGIDSSAVVACMAQISENPVETFSIVFNDPAFDESDYSRLVADKYKTKHTEFLLQPLDLVSNLPEYVKAMDNPTVDGINTYMVSKLVAKTGIKVVLTGIGGDELFAGYNGFHRWKKFRRFGSAFKNPLLSRLFKMLLKVKYDRKILKIIDMFSRKNTSLGSFYANSRSIYLDHEIAKLTNQPFVEQTNWIDLDSERLNAYPEFSQYSLAELSAYTLDVLMKDTDQMSMAWALEVREPFFDYQLIEFVLQVPDQFKHRKGTPKSLFVDAMGDLLPKEIVYRPKKGFTFPWNAWLRKELKNYCEETLASLSGRNLFKKEGIDYLWTSFLNDKNAITWMHIWALVILEKWMQENNIGV